MSDYETEYATIETALGRNVGLCADWYASAFYVARGTPGEYMRGDWYLLDRDDYGPGWELVRRWNVADDGTYPGLPAEYATDDNGADGVNDCIVRVATFADAASALAYIRAMRE